ncbi:MAG: fasciclin domain-containing protein [Cytophagales bacterium]
MKTQKSLLLVGIFAAFAIIVTSCGDGGKAAKEKAKQDSVRRADSVAREKAKADSIAALPKSIAETAINTPNLSTLVAALQAGELVDVLKGTDALTVFAPTNDAFAAIQSTVDMLLKAENKSKLQNVLKYHVVAGTVKAADLKDGQELTTLQGEKIKVQLKDGKVYVGGAEVTNPDVTVTNGVVHMINKVLVPKKM